MAGEIPLGLRIVVTRAAAQAGSTCTALEAAGARVELLPLSEVVAPPDPGPLEAAVRALESYDWLVFTSANGVAALFDRIGVSVPTDLKLAAVGPATAAALRRRGRTAAVALESGPAGARTLLAALVARIEPAARILLPQAADARPDLAAGLAAARFRVQRVAAYAKRLPVATPARARELFDATPLGWVTFASGSAARRLADLFGGEWPRRRPQLRAASIGAATSAELRALGVEPAAEALRPTDAELVGAIAAALGRASG